MKYHIHILGIEFVHMTNRNLTYDISFIYAQKISSLIKTDIYVNMQFLEKKKMMNRFCIKGFYEGIFINIYDLTQYSLYTYIRARSASRSTVVMTQWDYSFFGRRIISIFPSFYYVNSWIECTSNSYLLMSNESKRKK